MFLAIMKRRKKRSKRKKRKMEKEDGEDKPLPQVPGSALMINCIFFDHSYTVM